MASAVTASPSDLAEYVQNLSLINGDTHRDAQEEVQGSVLGKENESRGEAPSVSASNGTLDIQADIATAQSEIATIRNVLFQLEEQRHSGIVQSADSQDKSQRAIIEIDDRLESISRLIQRVEVSVTAQQQTGPESGRNGHDGKVDEDGASGDDDDDDDDDDFALPGLVMPKENHSTGYERFEQLALDWARIQAEVDSFKKEVVDDKYTSHFNSASQQAEDLMQSLEKAITVCQGFITDQRVRDITELDEDQRQERLSQLVAVRKAFRTKHSYYSPACEQTFAGFERSLRDRATSHGVLLRRFAELKARWQDIRQRSSKIEKELKSIELQLTTGEENDALPPAHPQLPTTPRHSMGSASTSTTPTLPNKNRMRAVSAHTTTASSKRFSHLPAVPPLPSSARAGAPAKPLRSPQRLVSQERDVAAPASGMRASPSSSSLLPGSAPMAASRHGRSISTSASPIPGMFGSRDQHQDLAEGARDPFRSPSRPRASDTAASPQKRFAHTLSSNPPSSFRMRATSVAPSQTTYGYAQSGTELDASGSVRPASALGGSPSSLAKMRAAERSPRKSGADLGDESMDGPIAAAPHSRPGSATGNYSFSASYRPPSSATTHVDPQLRSARRQSRLPVLAVPGSVEPSTPARPGSAMSQTSASAHPQSGRPSSRFGNYGASRSTMQTPEPQIAARVQRLSVYSRPSNGMPSSSVSGATTPRRSLASSTPSRPPTTRSNPRSTASSVLSPGRSSLGGEGRLPGSVGGRTTPLSASALAKVPHAGPLSALSPNQGANGGPPSNSSSSVNNFRLSRQFAAPPSTTPSRNAYPSGHGPISSGGAATPTASEGGHSALSGFAPFGGGGSRRDSSMSSTANTTTAGSSSYRSNPLDALDVEVSMITNALGVPLTRIDPPLPKGFVTETGPGKEVRCRYAFGGSQPMTTKLLELHKPASAAVATAAGAVNKQRKVLVKVPGKGFLDLELWLLSSFD
ncbi:unnamed protein product [Jaminaea pallidilutea]